MDELKKHSVAISLIALLLSIKFVFVPMIDWQNEQATQLRLLDKKLNKIGQLILQQDQLKNREVELDRTLSTLTSPFYAPKDADVFKRDIQKQIEDELESFELKLNNIGWQTTLSNDNVLLNAFSIEYSFAGEGSNVLNYVLNIAQSDKYSKFSEYSMSFSRQKPGKLGRITIRLKRVFYMKTSELHNLTLTMGPREPSVQQLDKAVNHESS